MTTYTMDLGESKTLAFDVQGVPDLTSLKVYIGSKSFDLVAKGGGIYWWQLTPNSAKHFGGHNKISARIESPIIGVQKIDALFYLDCTPSAMPVNSDATTDIVSVTTIITVAETAITVESIVYDYAKGTNGLTYIPTQAWASDAIGTGWSLTPTSLLKYSAWINWLSTNPSPPIASDFAGADWQKVVGDDGINATGTGVPVGPIAEGSTNAAESGAVWEDLTLKPNASTNFWSNNKYANAPSIYITSLPAEVGEGVYFYPNIASYSVVDAGNYFNYIGRCLEVVSGIENEQFMFVIPKQNYANDATFNSGHIYVGLEFYSPIAHSFKISIASEINSVYSEWAQKTVNAQIGVNKIFIDAEIIGTPDRLYVRRNNYDANWNNQTIAFGRLVVSATKHQSVESLNVAMVERLNANTQVSTNFYKNCRNLARTRILSGVIEHVEHVNSDSFISTDQVTAIIFGYDGMTIKATIIPSGNVNFFHYLPAGHFVNDITYKRTKRINATWELKYQQGTAAICKLFTVIGGTWTEIAAKTVIGSSGATVVNFIDIDLDYAFNANTDAIAIRCFHFDGQWFADDIYIGRLAVYSGRFTGTLDIVNQNDFLPSKTESINAWLKLVTLGDSITWLNLWQNPIANRHSLKYNDAETTTGVGVLRPMGVGSSRIIPLINDAVAGQNITKSIFERADDVVGYNPDIIILMGGQNDINAVGTVLGTVADSAYTGPAVYANPPTFCSAYKGTLEKLITQNPRAKILCVTPMWSSNAFYEDKKPFVDAIIAIANSYACHSIDMLSESGVNMINHNDLVPDGVHPNALLGERMASIISKHL